MSETKEQSAPEVQRQSLPFKFNEQACKEHLDAAEKFARQFENKPGHNAFIFLARQVDPLRLAMSDPKKQTKDLQDKIMKVNKSFTPSAENLGTVRDLRLDL